MTVQRILRLALLVLGLLVLIGTTVFIAVRWQTIPAEVPAHYDAAGHITDYDGKKSLLSVMGLNWVLYLFLAFTAHNPAMQNRSVGPFRIRVSGVRFGSKTVLPATGLMLDLLALIVALLFSYLTICSALGRELGAWFLPVTLIACLVPLLIPLITHLRK